MGVRACHPSTWQAETRKFQVQGQPGLHIETLSQKKEETFAGCQWLKPVILAIDEADIRRIMVPSQHEQIVCKILS
jgi:hypothetical protein